MPVRPKFPKNRAGEVLFYTRKAYDITDDKIMRFTQQEGEFMSIKPQYETYRYTGEICRLRSQSIVECRLSGSEIGSILAVHSSAISEECTCADGEVRYGGKVLLCIVYEDANGKICRVERGAEFYHKAEGASVSPACFAKNLLSVENVSHRREGSGLYISVVVGADIQVYGGKQVEYLIGGEEIAVQTQPVTLCKTVCVSGETEGEDEFDADATGDILLHSEKALVTACRANAGQVEIEGELNLGVCVLKTDESVCSYERLIPFRMQIPCEEAFGKVTAGARVIVKSAVLSSNIDEDKGRCKIVFSYTLSADCFLSAKEELSVCADAFSPCAQLELETQKDRGRYLTNQTRCVERVEGKAVLSPAIDGDYALCSAVLPRAEAVCKKTDAGFEIEGILTAEVLLKGENGYKSTTLSLPFVFPIDIEGEEVEADCMVCALNIRRKKDGETEAEANIKFCLKAYEEVEWEYICKASEGEKIEENESAISIFIPRAGEDLWQVAKRLSRMPEDLQKSNPDLTFPVKEGERIFVYRQIK